MDSNFESTIASAAASPDWWAVPIVIEAFQAAGGHVGGMAFWHTASKASGRPELSLRQMVRAYRFVVRQREYLGDDLLAAALRLPFSSLEVIVRIGDVDLNRALHLLANARFVPSVLGLRRELSRLRNEEVPRGSALVEGQRVWGTAIEFVADNLPRALGVTPPGKFVKWAAAVAAVSPSLVAVSDSSSQPRQVTAALVASKADQATVYRALGRAGWECSFFDSYWLALPSNADPGLETLVRSYRIDNLGVVRFEVSQSSFVVSLPPIAAAPCPDRRSHLVLPARHQR